MEEFPYQAPEVIRAIDSMINSERMMKKYNDELTSHTGPSLPLTPVSWETKDLFAKARGEQVVAFSLLGEFIGEWVKRGG